MYELSEELLILILLFLLIFIMINQILKRIFKEGVTSAVIGFIISLLSVYYISNSQIDFLEKTYSLTGIAILIAIPYLIIFFFLYGSNIGGVMRKMAWVFYSILNIMFLQYYHNLSVEDTSLLITIIIIATALMLLLDKWIKNKYTTIKNLR